VVVSNPACRAPPPPNALEISVDTSPVLTSTALKFASEMTRTLTSQ
jgi:hypothetical protein